MKQGFKSVVFAVFAFGAMTAVVPQGLADPPRIQQPVARPQQPVIPDNRPNLPPTGPRCVFADANLERRVRDALLAGNRDAAFRDSLHATPNGASLVGFENQLAQITRLEAFDIASAQGVECLTGLTYLRVSNQIKKLPGDGLRPIAWLTRLTELTVEFADISDVKYLERSTGLTKLNLKNNRIVDIGIIGTLVNLTEINLSNNSIVALPASFGNLTRVMRLTLTHNQLTDIAATARMTGLEELYINENPPLRDISALQTPPRLRRIFIDQCPLIQDIGPLARNPGIGGDGPRDFIIYRGTGISCNNQAENLIKLRFERQVDLDPLPNCQPPAPPPPVRPCAAGNYTLNGHVRTRNGCDADITVRGALRADGVFSGTFDLANPRNCVFNNAVVSAQTRAGAMNGALLTVGFAANGGIQANYSGGVNAQCAQSSGTFRVTAPNWSDEGPLTMRITRN